MLLPQFEEFVEGHRVEHFNDGFPFGKGWVNPETIFGEGIMFVLGSSTEDYRMGLGFGHGGESRVGKDRVLELVFSLLVSLGAPSGVPSSYAWGLWLLLWFGFFLLLFCRPLLLLGFRRWLAAFSVLELVPVSCGGAP